MQIEVIMRRVVREELAKQKPSKALSELWATEKEVIELCGKSRDTLYRAIKEGRIRPNDVRQNPIGKGYLIRRTALIADK